MVHLNTMMATPTPRMLKPKRRKAGLSYTDVLASCALFGLAGSTGITGLMTMNNNAALSRLQTGAGTVAQSRVDLILSDGPFNPQKGQTPPVLTLGKQFVGTASVPTIPIYIDPVTGQVNVKGWMETEVKDSGTTYGGQNVQLYQASVKVFYVYRGKQYQVVMNTLRTSDI